MKIFTNKKIWQKILIIMLIILFFQLFVSKPVHAGTGVLLEPITNLLARLGDGLMNIMQKTFMDMEASGVWIEEKSNTWLKILIVAAAILIATIAVAATILSGGAALTIVCTAVGAVVKIAGVGAVAYFAVSKTHLGNKGFFLPEYQLTPQAIFKNEIVSFDVNFFNPQQPVVKKLPNKVIPLEYTEETGHIYTGVNTSTKTKAYKLNNDEYKKFKETYGFEDSSKAKDTGKSYEYSRSVTQPDGTRKGFDLTLKQREWTHEGATYRVYYEYRKYWGDNYYIKDLTKISGDQTYYESSLARELQATISAWYKTFRDIAIVALLSVLVYIGIRITLSSIASDKAKYKQMLGDWVVAICLVFLMHYLMSFACTLNEKIINAISSITVSTYGGESGVLGKETRKTVKTKAQNGKDDKEATKEEKIKDSGVELFIIEGNNAKLAYDQLVGQDGTTDKNGNNVSGKDSSYNNRFSEDGSVLYWEVNDFMAQARIKGQIVEVDKDNNETNGNQTAVSRAGYNIIYVVLVLYTAYFCLIYLKRVVYMAFLTMVAPLVAITYPIDKINDGKAQAFDLWLKEYIFNLLMQPMHLIIYTVLVGSAMKFAAKNIFYVIVAMAFLLPAEKLLRKFFGFEKAQTAGTLGAGVALGTGLMMSGLNKLNKSTSSSGGNNGEGDEKEDGEEGEDKPKIRGKDFDEIDALINKGEDTNKPEDKLKYHKDLTNEQIDELKSEGIEPGDQEYDQYLMNHGMNPAEKAENITNSKSNTSVDRDTNNSIKLKRRRLVRPRRAIKRGLSHYGQGLVKRYTVNKAANGGIIRRSFRTAGGLATGAIAGTAGALIGITTGDPSKAFQYATTGALGGYALGKSGVNKAESKIEVPGTMEAVKQGYYGAEYKEKQEEKFKKQFMRDNKNLQKLEDKLKIDRKEAKKLMEDTMKYYLEHGITDMDNAIATYKLQKETGMSKEKAIATEHYANRALKGEDTRYMTAKKRKEHKETMEKRLKEHGSDNPEKDSETILENIDKFHKFKS